MANGTFSKSINWLVTTLRNATAEGEPLAYVRDKNVILGAHDELEDLTNRLPVIIVHKSTPSRRERWALVANTERRADVSILIECGIHPENLDWPYGNTELSPPLRGWDTFLSDIMNAIENAPNGLTLGNTVTTVSLTVSGEDVLDKAYIGAILVEGWVDFPAGGR